MKAKITSVQEEGFWYAQEIGNEFEIIEIPNDPDYLISTGKHEGKFIHREDCEIIIEEIKEDYKPLIEDEENES